MNIFYDGEIYDTYANRSGGISRYFDNLISNLPSDCYPTLTTARDRRGSHPQHPHLSLWRYNVDFRPRRTCHFLKQSYFQVAYRASKPQIAHPTYYSLITGRSITDYRCPVVVTVHDMIHELFRELVDADGWVAKTKLRAVYRADAILCVSENTKSDLLNCYPALRDRPIIVTPLATELSESCIDANAEIPEHPYFIYVGLRTKYKNFERLLLAFAQIHSKFPNVMLCIVGSVLTPEERQQIEDLHLTEQIKAYGFVNDAHLAKLYKFSTALVYPSLYEGFGIPPLEAMSCGTAVIASNVSSIPEVVGDAGLLFEPNSTSDLADRLVFLLENSSQRDLLIQKGKQRIQRFNWQKTVNQTVEVYRSLV